MKLNISDIIETETAVDGMFVRLLAQIDKKLKNEECVDKDTLCDLKDALFLEKCKAKKTMKDIHQIHCSHDLWMMIEEPYFDDDDMITYASCICISCLMEMPFDEDSYLNLYRNNRLVVKKNMFASGDFDLAPLDDVTVSDVRNHYFDVFNEQVIVGDDFYTNHDVNSIEEEVVKHYSHRHGLIKK